MGEQDGCLGWGGFAAGCAQGSCKLWLATERGQVPQCPRRAVGVRSKEDARCQAVSLHGGRLVLFLPWTRSGCDPSPPREQNERSKLFSLKCSSRYMAEQLLLND